MSAAAAPSALFRRTVRHLELASPAHSLKNIVKVSSVVPFFGPGNSGLRCALETTSLVCAPTNSWSNLFSHDCLKQRDQSS